MGRVSGVVESENEEVLHRFRIRTAIEDLCSSLNVSGECTLVSLDYENREFKLFSEERTYKVAIYSWEEGYIFYVEFDQRRAPIYTFDAVRSAGQFDVNNFHAFFPILKYLYLSTDFFNL